MKRTALLRLVGSLLVLLVVWLAYTSVPSAVAQEATGTPRPTPTNVGDGPRVTPTEPPPTATPEPPPPTEEPTEEPTEAPTEEPTDEPPSPPDRREPVEEVSQSTAPEPQATVATTVPNTGLMDVGGWSVLLVALGLVGTIFGARYLRHRDQDERKKQPAEDRR